MSTSGMYLGRDESWQYLCLGSGVNQFSQSPVSLILRISALLSCPVPPRYGQYRTLVIATFSFFHLQISWKLSKGWTHRPGPISWPTCSLSSSSEGETFRNWSNRIFSQNHHDLNTIWGWKVIFQFKNVRLSTPVDLLWMIGGTTQTEILCWECW